MDGNNVLDVYAATKLAVDRVRNGEGPMLLIAETFRMGGHATHDEHEARQLFPPETFEYWGKRDPIGRVNWTWPQQAMACKVESGPSATPLCCKPSKSESWLKSMPLAKRRS
jgi:TPP-dependent pyruvate/acetoin dehydrogenase alpha subunit